MTLKIYNTLNRSKEEFHPIEPGKVKMYVCGPTVYDYLHIGNARPLIFFDVVRRYLDSLGYEVHYVLNFTDVDDKLIRKAEQTGAAVTEIADRFIRAYYEDTGALGIEEAVHPRVTQTMPEIIAFITGLVDKGLAYESGGDVFFRTGRFPEYGRLSQQNIDELQFGIRVEVDERKENPQDFVLWKKAKPGEISWDSPWGQGRPGWHIECSAMADKYLGKTIDIHGGGQDLTFPHHECEKAQSESLHGVPLANYWMHNGYLNINDEKMSKSLGNGLNVRELVKTTSPEAVRFFMLSTHYRGPLNFTGDTVRQAESGLERIGNCMANVAHRMDTAAEGPADKEFFEALNAIRLQFNEKMDDDFNTPDAITCIFELVSETNRYLQQTDVTKGSLLLVQQKIREMNDILGIVAKPKENLLDGEIDRLIEERQEARKERNWARADEIRDLLTELGILLEDTPQGIRWRRK